MIAIVFGTRPELIKVAPLIKYMESSKNPFITINTGQHKEMLVPLLKWFNIKPRYNLNIMKPKQSLNEIVASSLLGIDKILFERSVNLVLVQGDTSTAFAGALAAFNRKIPVGHIEAGLRTDNLYNPYPEEGNRRLVSQIAHYHFAPTSKNKENLLKSDVQFERITVTGNTVIDALHFTRKKLSDISTSLFDAALQKKLNAYERNIITITGHRRENIGDGFKGIFNAIKRASEKFENYLFVFPVHLNPLVKDEANKMLGERKNILLTAPLDYPAFIELMSKSKFIISDSGGVQEEAPGLGIPVLVTRETTERVEALEAGTVKLIGSDENTVFQNISDLILDESLYQSMAKANNPYGDGNASKKIIEFINNEY